jgi:outer membrane lipoprotein-sorting protein
MIMLSRPLPAPTTHRLETAPRAAATLALALLLTPALAAQETPRETGRRSRGGSVAVAPEPDAPGLSASERLDNLIARIKWEQSRLQSMEAKFVQNKASALLLQPEESHGTLWYQAPDKARWEFTTPNPTTVLVGGEQMLTWYRDLKRAERVDIGKQADRIMQYLSASNSLETLQRYFILKVAFPKDPKEPYRLELTPRFSRVAKRIKSMAIHLDRQGYWPTFLQYVEPDGDQTELRFTGVKINRPIAADVFDIQLPADVEVKVISLAAKKAQAEKAAGGGN